MARSKKRRSKRLSLKAWDPLNANYADLSDPEWMAIKLPPKFWEDPQNHKRYIKWLAAQLGIKKLDDWYKVSNKDFIRRRGGRLLAYYEHSHIKFITTHVKRKHWYIWKFKYVPRGFWGLEENRIAYLRWLGQSLGYKNPEDWYQVSSIAIKQNYGKVIAEIGTFSEILSELYPDFDWIPWKFTKVERSFWRHRSNRIRYFQWFRREFKLSKLEALYGLAKKDFVSNYGRAFIDYYDGSTIKAVKDCVPDHDWLDWKFNRLPNDYWRYKKHRLKYLRWLGEEVGFKKPEDWYQISDEILNNNYGSTLIRQIYDGAPQKAAMELFPNKAWYPWLFVSVPKGFWRTKNNRLMYMRWLKKMLNIRKSSDWSKVEKNDFKRNRGGGLLKAATIPELIDEFLNS